jgi:hypothetical protein
MTLSTFHSALTPKYKTHVDTVPSGRWSHLHPHLNATFYEKLKAPSSQKEAKFLSRTHKDAAEDFQMQIEVVDQEILILKDPIDSSVPEYNCNLYEDFLEKKKRLMMSKRFHVNAMNAYDYFCYCKSNVL